MVKTVTYNNMIIKLKVKWYRYRPCVAQRVGRGIDLLFHDRGTRRGSVVSSTPRPHFTPRKDPVPILQAVGWAPLPVWTGGKSRPHRDSILGRPAHSQSLYRLSYPVHNNNIFANYYYLAQCFKLVCFTDRCKDLFMHESFRNLLTWAETCRPMGVYIRS